MVVSTRRRGFDHEPTVDAAADSDEESGGLTKKQKDERERQRRRNQKRKGKKKGRKVRAEVKVERPEAGVEAELAAEEEEDVEVEYVQQEAPIDLTDPNYFYFQKIFDAFKIGEEALEDGDVKDVKKESEPEKRQEDAQKISKGMIIDRIVAQDEEDKREKAKGKDGEEKVSRRKMRLMARPSIAVLKASCGRPDVVEWHDVTSKEAKLLVYIKSLRNTIPVPRHWCFKRKYLAGKRGFERPPFELPEFIRKTGICEMRQALTDKEEEKSLKTKMRERVRPKIGKIDIDYQKLHDAFFRWQTKPHMTIMGDLYFEVP